ncbi:50S ribosomal protein L11 [Fervidicoccus fontis]|jgi:large subunit ribosomal protein L11|uniref:Large ribosomal subunit protein uL11 n=2 Tax=Fervidicoccus fontis TaxID=683846 RepID=I0A2Q3_FERFK|nr:50S ribosomal protein L11 [Fervidicoccus fontis]AFH43260.1 50S ribosomal protein L11P [Fervidicoccus fontis Kam940]MBE9390638.1 50S ribosomal protein L11 [Fervidicoccus fontis]
MSEVKIINLSVKTGNVSQKDLEEAKKYGFNVDEIAEKINKRIGALKEKEVKITIYLYPSVKDYIIEVKPPTVTELLLWKAKAKEPSGDPAHKKVGDIKVADLAEVAIIMKNELLTRDLKKAVKMLLGSARSIGLTVEGKDPKDVQKELESGTYDKIIEDYIKDWEEH